MLKVNKLLASSWNHIGSIAYRQYFSVLQNKDFDAPAFDVQIQDFDENDLYGKISKIMKKPYLAALEKTQKQFQDIRTGLLYGGGNRSIISLPTRTEETKPIWIHYIIDTGSPYSFLTSSALKILGCPEGSFNFTVYINSHRCSVRSSHSNFKQVNILGMNFIENRKGLNYRLTKKQVDLTDDEKA